MHPKIVSLAVVLLLGGCVTVPPGPGVMALPGTGKSFEVFRHDDAVCRQFALEQSGGQTPPQAAEESIARSAVLGAVLGAVAGAVIDGSSGAGVGAGAGLLFGGASGAGAGSTAGYVVQRRYDQAYVQCMYAKEHQVPVSGRVQTPGQSYYGPPAGAAYPPPPPSAKRLTPPTPM